ncbi:hypothetical protein V2J09_019935 [Rumex salicifolius]
MAPATANPQLLFFLLLAITILPSNSDPRAKEALLVCSNQTAPLSNRQQFVSNFIAALDSLTPQISLNRHGAAHNGSANLSVYAFSQCFSDLSSTDCSLCFAEIKTQIQKCLPYQKLTRGGRLFFDGCYFRYEPTSFYTQLLSDQDRTVCGSTNFTGNSTVFKTTAAELARNLRSLAVNNSGLFSVGSLTKQNLTLYGLAQCWEYANSSACSSCLANAVSMIRSCPPKIEGRVMNAGCYLRYSTSKFYNNTVNPQSPQQGNKGHLVVILTTVLSSLALLMIVIGACFGGKRLVENYREKNQLRKLLSTMNKSKLHFAYEVLEEATNFFHESNKLGQGGSGSVYKGRLPDGTQVAIKRLFFNTRQWVDHFFNEINIISSIHHENLVKLLGCSITGPESLLVYEFVPNQSLQDHLFGYMAPEYIVCGILTEKADVYSFGVLLLEIISGKRNNSITDDSVCMLHTIWNSYVKRRLNEAIDKALEGKFKQEKASRLLQIGLLCVQANAELRPSMSMTVKLLTDNGDIPEPTQPPFLNSGSVEITRTTTQEGSDSRLGSRHSSSTDDVSETSCPKEQEGQIR